MPATKARKGSAAYEAGIREGRAMSAKSRRAPAPDPDESEELENEEEEMDMASTSRKRSAKNAKNTKAPMDGGMYGKKPMDAECGCKGKKGAKCDGNCGGAMGKRSDAALTPHEYLSACDLGIQDRSRSYIRTRLDAAARKVAPKNQEKGKEMGNVLKGSAGVALIGDAVNRRKGIRDSASKSTLGARKPKVDSVYASGFALDTSALAI